MILSPPTKVQVSVGAALLALLASGPAVAAEPRPISSETREFEIIIGQSRAGASTVTIATFEDGRTVATSSANVRVTVVLYTYVYQFEGVEEWQDGRFQALSSRTVDGLTRLSLQAQVDADRTTLQTGGGKLRATVPHALTSNLWRAPPDAMLGKRLAMLDADTGKTLNVQFQDAGVDKLILLDKHCTCRHLKMTGDKESEFWFDELGRIVRQTGIEDGYKTEVRLTARREIRPRP